MLFSDSEINYVKKLLLNAPRKLAIHLFCQKYPGRSLESSKHIIYKLYGSVKNKIDIRDFEYFDIATLNQMFNIEVRSRPEFKKHRINYHLAYITRNELIKLLQTTHLIRHLKQEYIESFTELNTVTIYDTGKICKLLFVHKTRVRCWIKKGWLPCITKDKRRYVFTKDDLMILANHLPKYKNLVEQLPD